jgi:hypothetical protein
MAKNTKQNKTATYGVNGFYSINAFGGTTAPLTNAKNLNITHITKMKQQGGVYALQFGAGDFKPEVLATLLTPASAAEGSARQLYAGRDRFLEMCADKDLRRFVFSKIWPNMHQRIKLGIAAVTADEVLKMILQYMDIQIDGDTGDIQAVNAFLELMVYMLGMQNLIVPSQGFVSLDVRSQAEPTLHDFRVEAIRQELETIFSTLSARVKFPAKEMTPEVYLSMVDKEFDGVVHHMESIDRTLRHVNTALAITRQVLTGAENVDSQPHPDAMGSTAVVHLTSNSTWVMLALDSDAVLSPERFDHLTAVNTMHQIISRSPRFDVVPISDIAQNFLISQIRDARGNVRAGVITKNKRINYALKAGVIVSATKDKQQYRFMELPTYGEPLARAVENVNKMELSTIAHHSITNTLGDMFIAESDIGETDIHVINVTEGEMFALACHFADTVSINRAVKENQSWLEGTIVFQKDIGEMRIFASELPIAQRIVTTNPLSIVATVEDHMGSVASDTGTSTVPSEMFARVMTQPQERWFHKDYNSSSIFRVKLGESELSYEMKCPQLFGQDERNNVALFRHIESETLIPKVLETMMQASRYAMSNNQSTQNNRQIQRSMAFAMHAVLQPMLGAPIMEQLTDAVFRAMARKIEKIEDRELTYHQLTVSRVKYEVITRVTGFMMQRAHLMTDSTFASLLEFYDECEFFETLNSADLHKFLGRSIN